MSTVELSNVQMKETSEAPTTLFSEEEKWRAVLTRSGSSDGVFVFAVRSTGIYCKPSCPAKRPRREQVVFFSGPEEAEQSGFRPCQRCKPRETERSPQAELVKRVCSYIESNLEGRLTLSNISAHVGVSPYHLQRTFKRVLGISPRQYAEARRLAMMKVALRNGASVTKALYRAGFSSRSRLYEKVPDRFGMPPGTYRRGGVGMRVDYTITDCPLGRLLVATTDQGICSVCLGDSDEALETTLSNEYPAAQINRNEKNLLRFVSAFQSYFGGRPLDGKLPLDVRATAFQWKVWNEIQSIPYGKTATYGEIARDLGVPQGARAVANACAKNPVSLLVPCHRVVRGDGSLGGYRWGKKRKQALLSLEQAVNRRADLD